MALSVKKLEKIANSPVPTDRVEIADGDGLYLVRQSSGVMSWAYRYRFGKPRKMTLGRFPAMGLADAREARKAASEILDLGRDPGAEKIEAKNAPDPERDLFRNVVLAFIEKHAKPENKSWKQTAWMLGLRENEAGELVDIPGGLCAEWGKRPIQEIAKRDVIEHLDDMVEDDRGATANRKLATLRKFFNWCIGRGIDGLVVSPCVGVPLPAPINSRDRVLSDDEIRWMWKAVNREGYPFGDLVKLLLLTGQRRNEVAGMTDRELSLPDRNWEIASERTKNGLPQIVPLSDAALAIINGAKRVKGKAGYVFSTTGDTHISGFSKAKAAIDATMAKEAGHEIPRWTLHDLRRTAATKMAGLGVEPHVIEAVLNHVSGHKAGVAGIYNRHAYEKEKRAALALWARHVERLTDNGSNVVPLRA